MSKKILTCSLLLILTFIIAPIATAYSPLPEQLVQQPVTETPQGILGTAYIAVIVLTYTPGQGIKPCQGADIHLRSILRSYNGTTNEKGIHLFAVHTSLLREKHYLATVSINAQNQTMMRIGFIHLKARQVVYKGFLFLLTNETIAV
jgi:hypothetical protein